MYNIIRLIFTFVVFFFIGFCAYSIIRPLWAHEATVEEAPLNCDKIDLGTYDYTHVSTNRPTRNNNPGNIRKTGRDYYGETSNDPAFESFAAPEWGYAAMFDLLDRLYTGLTLSEAIYKWAPPVENDTERYVKFVAKKTGYDRNVTLDPSYIPEEHPGVGQPEYEDLMESLDDIMHRDYLRVYSVSNKGWRTIKPSKLISWVSG